MIGIKNGLTGVLIMENDLKAMFLMKALIESKHKINVYENEESEVVMEVTYLDEFNTEIYGTDFLAFLDNKNNKLKVTVIEETKEVILEFLGEKVNHLEVDYISIGE